MKRQQAFKVKLSPSGQQQRELRRFAGSCRFVFNRALALQKAQYEAGEAKASYSKLWGWLTEWKQLWQGGQVLAVPPQPTSQTGSSCGRRAKENRRSQSTFGCVNWDYTENADLKAAMAILAAGQAVLACGERA